MSTISRDSTIPFSSSPTASEFCPHVQAAAPPRDPKTGRVAKRIIVCCDGTWEDGLLCSMQWQNTNVLKLSRMIRHLDDRHDPPVHQIMFYQPGVGTEPNWYSEYVDGAIASSLVSKVKEAYAFIANNYHTGDEIYLFGFSRGAYTARMVAAIVGEIGVIDRHDMDHFADIFVAYQKSAKLKNAQTHNRRNKDVEKAKAYLDLWRCPTANGITRADPTGDAFTIKCLGVFDTVGAVGLPGELRFGRKMKPCFSFPDTTLGAHVENAFHAMALDEQRKDFNVVKFQQEEPLREGQVLKQVWFAGRHSDIGGSYQEHDLADITLTWMASNIQSMLNLDINYLRNIPRPTAAWGTHAPHDAPGGIFNLCPPFNRPLPKTTGHPTYEQVHHSVCSQFTLPHITRNAELAGKIKQDPAFLCSLGPLEKMFQNEWPKLKKGRNPRPSSTLLTRAGTALSFTLRSQSINEKAKGKPSTVSERSQSIKEKGEDKSSTASERRHSWFGTVAHGLTSSS